MLTSRWQGLSTTPSVHANTVELDTPKTVRARQDFNGFEPGFYPNIFYPLYNFIHKFLSATLLVSEKGYIYNRLPVLQISIFRSSSLDLVAASGQRRPAKPSGALYVIQSTTTCCTDCVDEHRSKFTNVTDMYAPTPVHTSPRDR